VEKMRDTGGLCVCVCGGGGDKHNNAGGDIQMFPGQTPNKGQ